MYTWSPMRGGTHTKHIKVLVNITNFEIKTLNIFHTQQKSVVDVNLKFTYSESLQKYIGLMMSLVIYDLELPRLSVTNLMTVSFVKVHINKSNANVA